MIGESVYWKQPLLDAATRLREAIGKVDLPDEQCAQLERDVFLGFYSIRKLFEAAGKVSGSTRARRLSVAWFPKLPRAPVVDWYNRNEIWELYDLDNRRSEDRDLLYVAHRLIHSFIFMQSVGDAEDADGFFFTSDRDKEHRVNFIETVQVIEAFDVVGHDYPADFQSWRDISTGEMKWST